MKIKIIQVILIIITFLSCNNSNTQDKDIYLQGSFVGLQVRDGSETTFMTLDVTKDSLLVLRYSERELIKSIKIKARNNLKKAIKECVFYHLRPECIFEERSETLHGNKVRFYIVQASTKYLEASYPTLGEYTEVSPKFDSLFTFIKKENKDIYELLLTK